MEDIVIDSSVLLACINKEEGFLKAESLLTKAIMSSVNVAEVFSILYGRKNIPYNTVEDIVYSLVPNIYFFSKESIRYTAEIEKFSRKNNLSLSLGDRACLSLGLELKCSVYTADRLWSKVRIPGLETKLIR